ncbi:PH domain-containing protein [Bacillus shivajii]|uniref:PH domain-containing protein n=1 Tax=Bacillus shivajii TaxID=1983719 RepID=UPI001CF9DB1D|nr:PH domain-containing protein [Bacillus shivajii]UCZ54843.1 PH domain-containing protein [Bacillus shivajii]
MNSWNRQHPIAIFISFLNNLKEMIITFIAVIIFGQAQAGGSTFYIVFFSLILIISLGNGIIRWWTFRYQLFENEIKIKHGLIFRKNRYIRKEKIQSIDINAKLLQRIFGLVEVRIETAGGGDEPEFKITALKKHEAAMIKEQLLRVVESPKELNDDEMTGPLDEKEEAEEVHEEQTQEQVQEKEHEEIRQYKWMLSNPRLVIAAMTSSGVGIAATFVAAIMSQVQQFIPNRLYEQVIGFVIHHSILFIGSWVVFILFIAWVITVIRTLLKYGMFSVTKRGSEIHISRGVVEKRQLTLSDHKITAVRIVQNLLRQPFGFVAVYVESAGGGSKEEDLSTILIPMCKRNEVEGLLQELLPDYDVSSVYETLPGKSLRRYMIRLIVPSLIAASVFTYFIPYGWLAFILPLLAALLGYWQYKDAGLHVNDQFLFLRSRSFVKTEFILPRKRIQSMDMSQHYLQKIDHLFSLHVSVLSSITGKTFLLRHISGEQSNRTLNWYSYERNK